jgi:hypothetical protein
MPTKNPSNSTDGSEDGLTQLAKKKVQRGRLSSITRSQDRPKLNASRPDNHKVAPLLDEYASAKTSKTTASLPPICLGDNKTKCKTNQSQGGGEKRMARANMEGAGDTVTDVAGTHIKSAENLAVLPTPAVTSTHIGAEAGPPFFGGAEVQGGYTIRHHRGGRYTNKIGGYLGNGHGGVTSASGRKYTTKYGSLSTNTRQSLGPGGIHHLTEVK